MNLNLHYIAGFFDGEGTCGMYSSRAHCNGIVKAKIAQQKVEILREIQEFLLENHGIKSLLRINTHGTALSKRPVHVLEIYGRQAPIFLKLIYPYLRVKKTLAQDIVRHKTLYPPIPPRLRGRLAAETRWGTKLTPT